MCELTNTDEIDLSKYYDNPEDYILLTDDLVFGDSRRPKWAFILAGARKLAELSVKEAAIRLGIKPKELKRIEKGLTPQPSKAFIYKMHKVYNMPISSLIVD